MKKKKARRKIEYRARGRGGYRGSPAVVEDVDGDVDLKWSPLEADDQIWTVAGQI